MSETFLIQNLKIITITWKEVKRSSLFSTIKTKYIKQNFLFSKPSCIFRILHLVTKLVSVPQPVERIRGPSFDSKFVQDQLKRINKIFLYFKKEFLGQELPALTSISMSRKGTMFSWTHSLVFFYVVLVALAAASKPDKMVLYPLRVALLPVICQTPAAATRVEPTDVSHGSQKETASCVWGL